MPVFDLRFHDDTRAVLAQLAETIAEAGPGAVLARSEPPPDDDPDFADGWIESLHDRIGADTEAVLALLRNPAFGSAPLELSDDEALAIIRGFTVLRLTLRETALNTIDDADLESGRIDRRRLSAPRRHALACYAVLGDLQGVFCALLES